MITFTENTGYATDFGMRLFPDRVALIQEDLELSYGALDERSNQIANGLLDRGVRKGDAVFLLYDNDVRFVEAILGVMRIGAVAVPANNKQSDERIVDMVSDSGSKVLLAGPSFAAKVAELRPRLACESVFAIGAEDEGEDLNAWMAASSSARPQVSVTGDDLCMLPYTSGSTGRPKGVMIRHRNWLWNTDLMRRVMMLRPDDRALCANPLFHANALSLGIFPSLLAGGSAVVLPRFDPTDVVRAIEKWGCTFMTGVPTMYRMLVDQPGLKPSGTRSMRFLICGSAPMTKGLLADLDAAFPGVTLVEGYGLTEGGPSISFLPRFGARRMGSVGLPMPEVEVKLLDSSGQEVDVDTPGELWTRNPGVAAGYHGLPAETSERFRDGWLRTGDMLRRDSDGYLYYCGRADERMNVAGEHAFPAEVEAVLLQHPQIRDVVVTSCPHALKNEVPVAHVVPAAGAVLDPKEVRDFFCARAPRYAQPRGLILWDALPVSPTGKTDRATLSRAAAEAFDFGRVPQTGSSVGADILDVRTNVR
ncbi:class I adenylate-forming enzyme family protein [Nocardioides sp.]|uniref:class I adenylate-forming enzyme family protein n=1 Tax=Nocardioides sp. TaxID=35761 RepID=UPI00262C2176|nr:class I adenylate-forming enzyme family protein [Nocardioides sp.]MDI6912328.1 class I adenylate-forming enzyme family protein [Nocardioides sp.]